MKFSTTATAAMLVLAAAHTVDAFSLSPPNNNFFTQRTTVPSFRQITNTATTTTTTTRLDLLPEAAMESSTIITSLEGIIDGLGSLALLGSVGFGLAFSNLNDPNWSYEYKVGNDGHYVSGGSGGGGGADVALLEESPGSIMEKVSVECVDRHVCLAFYPHAWLAAHI